MSDCTAPGDSSQKSLTSPTVVRLKTLGVLGLLAVALPVNAAVTGAALLRSASRRSTSPAGPTASASPTKPTSVGATDADGPLTVLISGGKMTKALALARSFHRAGHRVVLVESGRYRLTGHRFSRSVDRFHTVPKAESSGYVPALVDIVRAEGVDVYVPVCSPVASEYDAVAKAALADHCEVVHGDADTVRRLDDKYEFSLMAAAAGLPMPECYRITDAQQVLDFDFAARAPRRFILKSIPYDPVNRLDLTPLPLPNEQETEAFLRTKPISPDTPWIMQELLSGQEYCTHSTVSDGELQLHCCCESSAFQINYEEVDKPKIEAWVRQFVRSLDYTGQLSFDFIETAAGEVLAIECNPRTHSAITMFYDHPGVASAYLARGAPLIRPTPESRPTYWIYHELWRLLTQPTKVISRLIIIARGTDAIFDWDDPLPFLAVHHLQIPRLLLSNLRQGKEWIRIDFNIGKLIEPGGD